LPGELVAQAADCADRVHVGVDGRAQTPPPEYRPPAPIRRGVPASPGCLPPSHAPNVRAHSLRDA
jgi:hypothetical protein